MKKVSRRRIRKYMDALIREVRSSGDRYLPLDAFTLQQLRNRQDYAQVMSLLSARGLAVLRHFDPTLPATRRLFITDVGMRYFEDSADVLSERRWTRGLSIAAIIISLIALALEFDDRGFFDVFKTTPLSVQSSTQWSAGQSPER